MAFKVGDRVRYHHAGHVGWFATVAKVCGSEVWLRDYSNGYPDDDEESDQAWCATYDFLPAPRYEQCGCLWEGYTAMGEREVVGPWCGTEHPLVSAETALDALTAGLRALSAEGAKPAKDSGGSAGAATRKDESLRAERARELAPVAAEHIAELEAARDAAVKRADEAEQREHDLRGDLAAEELLRQEYERDCATLRAERDTAVANLARWASEIERAAGVASHPVATNSAPYLERIAAEMRAALKGGK